MIEIDGTNVIKFADNIVVGIATFKGEQRVDIRKIYTDDSGVRHFTTKSINMTVRQFSQFLENIPFTNDQIKQHGKT